MNRKDTATEGGDGKLRLRGLLVVLLSLAGLGLAGYLSVLHLGLMIGEVEGSALCGGGQGLACHAVTASRYAEFLGVPVSIWGLFFYITTTLLGLGAILFRGGRGRPYLLWALGLVALGVLFDVYLGAMMVFRIQVICPLCAATYAVNLGMLVSLYGVWKGDPGKKESLGSILPRLRIPAGGGDGAYYANVARGLLVGAGLLLIAAVTIGFLVFSRSYSAADQAQLRRIQEAFSRMQPVQLSNDGAPGLGNENAPITIVEFSDFRCPFCRRAADMVKIVAANNRDSARFVFRNYPLDASCNQNINRDLHPGACLLAEGGVCAHEQGKFWEYHDEAFRSGGRVNRSSMETMAARSGIDLSLFRDCLVSGRARETVRRDIQEAAALGVNSTPTFFFNGRPLRGMPRNPWMFEQLIRNPLAPAAAASPP